MVAQAETNESSVTISSEAIAPESVVKPLKHKPLKPVVVPSLRVTTTSDEICAKLMSEAKNVPPTAVTGTPVKLTRIASPEVFVEMMPGSLNKPPGGGVPGADGAVSMSYENTPSVNESGPAGPAATPEKSS